MTESSVVCGKSNFPIKLNENSSMDDNKNNCNKCQRPIREMYILIVDKKKYHEDCLRCSCCDARLAELDKLCYQKANMMLCKRDYLRLYGNTGLCSACDSKIQAFEYVMKAKNNTYHLDCFTCHLCKMRFCVGDKFYLHETNKIICEKDHNILLCSQSHNNNNHWMPSINTMKSNGNMYTSQNISQSLGNPTLLVEKPKTNNTIISSWMPQDHKSTPIKNPGNSLQNPDSQPSPNKFEDVSSGYDSPSPINRTIVN